MTTRGKTARGTKGDYIRVGRLETLKRKGMMVVAGRRCPILVLYEGGRVHALDNRCPHLGFPLHRGSVEDGILTCHWHHARFDLESGGTFNLWADDVPMGRAEIRGDTVWVAADCGYADEAGHWRRRLGEAMAHNLGLVAGKAILGLLEDGAEGGDGTGMLADAFLFGARNRDDWGSGMTILAALANVLPDLDDEDRYLAYFHGIREVAEDCEGAAARRERAPLGHPGVPLETLKRWLRQWTLVRHRDGAERTLLTAIANGASPPALADLLLSAVTDRYYADGGHALDFINKAMEALDHVGWQHAGAVLPGIIEQMVGARGREEANAWRHPIDLVPLLEEAFASLPALIKRGRAKARKGAWRGAAALAHELLDGEPASIAATLGDAVAAGARPVDLSRALAYAAALRLAHFGTANEFSDWNSAHHSFTYCNALHQLLKRVTHDAPEAYVDGVRGVYHGAMTVYLDRFLNIPPARLPGEGALDALPREAPVLRARLLEAMDRQQQVEPAAQLVARYLGLGHDPAPLIATLGHALLREDAGFHTFQNYEAALAQYREWDGVEGHHILIALARFLAAHAPTPRAHHQTATIARRLHRKVRIYADDEADEPRAAE